MVIFSPRISTLISENLCLDNGVHYSRSLYVSQWASEQAISFLGCPRPPSFFANSDELRSTAQKLIKYGVHLATDYRSSFQKQNSGRHRSLKAVADILLYSSCKTGKGCFFMPWAICRRIASIDGAIKAWKQARTFSQRDILLVHLAHAA